LKEHAEFADPGPILLNVKPDAKCKVEGVGFLTRGSSFNAVGCGKSGLPRLSSLTSDGSWMLDFRGLLQKLPYANGQGACFSLLCG
jgi:hypothetical protein